MAADNQSSSVKMRSDFWLHSWKSLVIISCLACYAGFSTYQLALPGLEYDEAIFGPAALGYTQDFLSPSSPPTLDSASRFSPIAFSPFSLSVGPYSVPLMVMPYLGALKVYVLALVFSCWDVSPWTIRLPNVVVGLLTLIFFFLVFARLFSPTVALIALGFLALDPSYIFYTRHDFNPSALVLLLVIVPLWCLIRWEETGQTKFWAAAFFLFGLGLYNRLDHLWFLAALCMTGILYMSQGFWSRVGKRELVLATTCFTLGCTPFLLFVWQRPTVAASVFSLAAPPQDFSSVARVKGYVLWTVLNGTSLYDFFSGRSEINTGKEVAANGEVRVGSYVADKQVLVTASLFTGTLTPYLLCLFAGVIGFFRPPPALKALMVFLLSLAFCVFMVPGALRGHHFVMFLLFVPAFLAASLSFLWQKSKTRVCKAALLVTAVACIAANVAMNLRYHSFLAVTGGRGVWSEAIYDLARYLQERCQTQQCLIGDWGLGTQVVTLAEKPLLIREFFWPYIAGESEEGIDDLVLMPGTLFVFYAEPQTNFSRPKRLLYEAARRAGYTIEADRVFVERDGVPVIEVVKVGGLG